MEFRTIIEPLRHQGLIDHSQSVLMIGSCFTENIGARLKGDLFNVELNPTGILYNPLSIAQAIDSLIDERRFACDDLFCHEGLWRSFSHHSSFASADINVALERMNEARDRGSDAVKNSGVLIVTFGSSTAYRHIERDEIVANCHKLPAAKFEVVDIDADIIVERWNTTISRLRELNPSLKIIFTVSPIRHKAYGLSGNTLNKARLIEAVHALTASNHDAVYFPSYEIMLDDLRDYRFYAADMIHPSEVACDYIYDIFSRSFFSDRTAKIAEISRKLSRRLSHRLFNDDPVAVAAAVREKIELINNHISEYPATKLALIPVLNDLQSFRNR